MAEVGPSNHIGSRASNISSSDDTDFSHGAKVKLSEVAQSENHGLRPFPDIEFLFGRRPALRAGRRP
jgi:hypothetical protein